MLYLNVHTSKNTRETEVPESWNELSGDQLREIAALLMQEADKTGMDVRLCAVLTGLSARELQQVGAGQIAETLLPLTQWVHEGNTLTRQLLPALQTQEGSFYGPADYLQNLRCGEFEFAERALWEWQNDTANDEKLWRFVATLYRPAKPGYDFEKDPDGDCRMAFNANATGFYAKILQRDCQHADALAVMLFYTGCRLWMAARYEAVFGGGGGEGNGEDNDAPPSLFQLMRAVAKTGTYGDFESVVNMYLYTLLAEVVAAMEEAERLQDEMKNMQAV